MSYNACLVCSSACGTQQHKFNTTCTPPAQQGKPTDHTLGRHTSATLLKMVLNIYFQFQYLCYFRRLENSSRIGISTQITPLSTKHAFSRSIQSKILTLIFSSIPNDMKNNSQPNGNSSTVYETSRPLLIFIDSSLICSNSYLFYKMRGQDLESENPSLSPGSSAY